MHTNPILGQPALDDLVYSLLTSVWAAADHHPR
jgi:hypothetical protein